MIIKYLITWEQFVDWDGDTRVFEWVLQKEYYYNYEQMIREYAYWSHNATKYPDNYRDVRVYNVEQTELLPDTPDLVKALDVLRKKDEEEEKRMEDKKKEDEANTVLMYKQKDEFEHYLRLKKKYEGGKQE